MNTTILFVGLDTAKTYTEVVCRRNELVRENVCTCGLKREGARKGDIPTTKVT